MPENFKEFMVLMLNTFPNAEVGEDNDGQLVIYTALAIKDGKVVSFEPED
jgi:hypothetical protein